ncbi:MAG: hypothetical protein WDM92_08360 [Caulobacteraceae bacterium]
MARHGVAEGFMNTASPGLITAFQPNAYYKTHEDYVWALAGAIAGENTRSSPPRASCSSSTAPISPWPATSASRT